MISWRLYIILVLALCLSISICPTCSVCRFRCAAAGPESSDKRNETTRNMRSLMTSLLFIVLDIYCERKNEININNERGREKAKREKNAEFFKSYDIWAIWFPFVRNGRMRQSSPAIDVLITSIRYKINHHHYRRCYSWCCCPCRDEAFSSLPLDARFYWVEAEWTATTKNATGRRIRLPASPREHNFRNDRE